MIIPVRILFSTNLYQIFQLVSPCITSVDIVCDSLAF